MANIEEDARNAVRNETSDDAIYQRTAVMWQGILGVPVSREQMALCMVARDVSRLAADPGDRQAAVGAIGYLIRHQEIR